MPFEGFLGQIRNPSNDMPAYAAEVMSDQAVADIYAYMHPDHSRLRISRS
jgi:mono/diheme cytochrome c family protein